jgi:hypothetical protein
MPVELNNVWQALLLAGIALAGMAFGGHSQQTKIVRL